MSLRNRARSLQKKTRLSYQQAYAKLRALGRKPARLSAQTGWPLEVCDRFLIDGHAPISVVEVPRLGTIAELCEQVCETLRLTANARAVVLSSRNGGILARAGKLDLAVLWRTTSPTDDGTLELGDGLVLYFANLRGAMLVVQFHPEETSLGLVKQRARRAIEDLERLLAHGDSPPGMPPPGGRGGPSGLPAEVRVAEAPPPHKPPRPKRKKR